jgi:hypothetical protein
MALAVVKNNGLRIDATKGKESLRLIRMRNPNHSNESVVATWLPSQGNYSIRKSVNDTVHCGTRYESFLCQFATSSVDLVNQA